MQIARIKHHFYDYFRKNVYKKRLALQVLFYLFYKCANAMLAE